MLHGGHLELVVLSCSSMNCILYQPMLIVVVIPILVSVMYS